MATALLCAEARYGNITNELKGKPLSVNLVLAKENFQ
jgi:hypothetical protein